MNNTNSNTESPVRSIACNDGETASQVTNMPSYNRSNILTSPSSRLSVQEEHRSLFGYTPPNPRSSCTQSQRGSSSKERVITGRNGKPVGIPVKDTWMHNFVCLNNTCDETTPGCKQRVELSMAGLGEKKVTFKKNGELLRTEDGRRHLIVIPFPPGGYAITYLKGVLNQAKAYVRPIQKNLLLDVEKEFCEVSFKNLHTQLGTPQNCEILPSLQDFCPPKCPPKSKVWSHC